MKSPLPLGLMPKVTLSKLRSVFQTFKKKSYKGVPAVWCIEGEKPGKTALISVLTHSCEVNGMAVLDYFLKNEKSLQKELKGRVILTLNNLAGAEKVFKAKTKKERSKYYWLDENMNRLQVEALTEKKPNREVKRLQALYPIFKEVDYALDLHALPIHGDPMILDVKGNLRTLNHLAEHLPVKKRITHITPVQIGHPISFFCGGIETKNTLALEMETGVIETQEGYQNAIDFSRAFLSAIGHLPSLKPQQKHQQEVYRAYLGVCFPNLSYELTALKGNFEFVRKGTVLATGNQGPIIADRNSYVLFPRSQKKYTELKKIQTEILFLAEKQ